MGQQQLLLLVLATVIVGLATVAGIQAFDENQTQAAQDALVQRGTSIMSDVKGELSKPDQLGGISYSSASASDVLDKLGYEQDVSGDGSVSNQTTVPVDGAPGSGAKCDLGFNSSGTAGVLCTSSEADQAVLVTLSGGEISTEFGSTSNLSKPSG
jgi:hypothetical protein